MSINRTVMVRHSRALKALLVTTVPLSVLFCAINVTLEMYLLASLNALLLAICLGLLLILRRNKISTALRLTYLTAVFANLAWIAALPSVYPTGHTWLPLFPVLSYLVLEQTLGWKVSVISLIVATGAFIIGAQKDPALLSLGAFVNVVGPVLGLFVVCHFYTLSRMRDYDALVKRALTDPLTGLWNRARLSREFERERKRALRTGMPFSMILIDLDYFKKLNDTYGHEAGDAALVFFAKLLKGRMRGTDLPCRIGGEEFVVLLPDTTTNGALSVAENLRLTLKENELLHGGNRINMTLSAGIVEFGLDGNTWPQLYRAADARLYASKERGRDCVLSHVHEAAAVQECSG